MAALPAVAKTVRLDIHSAYGSDTVAQNRLFFQYAGALSVTDAGTWLTNIQTGWAAFMTARISNQCTTSLLVLTDLTSSTAAQVQNATTATGGLAGADLPAGTAMVLKKTIARRYRGGHPRFYVVGLIDTLLTSTTQFSGTAVGNMAGSFQTFINACTANTNPAAISTITHVNVSYYHGFTNFTFPSGRIKAIPTPRATPVVDAVVNIAGNPFVASQRRRNQQP